MSDRSPFDSPPHSAQSEAALLGALICDGKQVEAVGKLVSPSDFYLLKHQSIYESILRCQAVVAGASAGSIDIVQLRESLNNRGLLNDVGGVQYLIQLAESCPDASNASHYAHIIREHAGTRGVLAAAQDVLSSGGNGTLKSAVARFIQAAGSIDSSNGSGAIVRTASNIAVRRIEWLWRNRFVAGAINLLIGMPDVGKSILTCDLAGRITSGAQWPPIEDGDCAAPHGDVVFLAAEDSPETTLVPRLVAAGADLERCHFIEGVHRAGERDAFDISRDIHHLESIRKDHPDLKLVVIDPLDSYLNAKVDTNIGNKARAAMWPIKDWAEQTGVTVIVVHHFNKSATTVAIDKVSGARSFGALPRSVWAVGRDPSDDSLTVLAPIKLNLIEHSKKKGICYRVVPSLANADVPTVQWIDRHVDLTANEIVAGKETERDKVADWLADMLRDGPMPAKELQQHAEDAGHSWRTVNRAKDEAGAASRQVSGGDGKVRGWEWYLIRQQF